MSDSQPDEPMDDRPYHPDQLRPGNYPPYNHVMHGPKGRTDVGSIWTRVGPDDQGYFVTSIPFDLDDRQRAMLDAGGHVQVNIWQAPMPPINVCVEGPYCECHDAEMIFDEHDGGFRCAAQQEVGSDSSPLEAAHQDFKPVGDDGAPEPGPDDAGDGPAASNDPVGG